MNLLLLVAAICFVVAGLAPILTWDLGHFDPIAWGLAAFAASFMWVLPRRR
jgi:hypothetical protein